MWSPLWDQLDADFARRGWHLTNGKWPNYPYVRRRPNFLHPTSQTFNNMRVSSFRVNLCGKWSRLRRGLNFVFFTATRIIVLVLNSSWACALKPRQLPCALASGCSLTISRIGKSAHPALADTARVRNCIGAIPYHPYRLYPKPALIIVMNGCEIAGKFISHEPTQTSSGNPRPESHASSQLQG